MEQSEIDALLNGETPMETPMENAGGENLGWNDVQQELEQSKKAEPRIEASVANFEELPSPGRMRGAPQLDLDFILDIPLTLSAELGHSRLLISELLQLGQGSVIRIDEGCGRADGYLCEPKTDCTGRGRRRQRKIRCAADRHYFPGRAGQQVGVRVVKSVCIPLISSGHS